MKLRLPRRRLWRVAIYLLCLLLVLLAIDLVLVQVGRTIHPGFDTTRIVAPRLDDGSIDDLLAIDEHFGRGVTPENNAAVLVIQALGRQALSKNQPTDGITDRLGMPHVPEKGDSFVTFDEYKRAHARDGGFAEEGLEWSDFTDAMKWPPPISPGQRQWVKDSKVPLDVLVEASKRSRFFIPFYGGTRPQTIAETLLPYISAVRDASKALLDRALLRLQAGDVAGFREDVLAVHRLARLLGQEAALVERVAALQMEGWACQADELAAKSGKLSAEQARGLARDLSDLSDLPTMSQAVNFGERLMILDLLQTAARVGPWRAGRLFQSITNVYTPFGLIPVWHEKVMRTFNHLLDGALAADSEPTYPQRIQALRLWEDQITQAHNESFVVQFFSSEWLVQLLMADYTRFEERSTTAREENQLAQTALALAAFKADHGSYPATLDELSLAELPRVPNDIFSEKPLVYSRTADGFLLYSVGPNMTDDGGKSGKGADDLVVRVP